MVIVLDASGSMWGQVAGEAKITIARRALSDLLPAIPAETEVGLVVYGHRTEGDCGDIEVLAPLAPLDVDAFSARFDALSPKGKTPITGALTEAFGLLAQRRRPATVILVSDGLETCGGDPCALVRAKKASGADFVLHVIGFDVGEGDVSQLECAAQAGGGRYFAARSAGELSAALEASAAAPAAETGRISVKATADGTLADVLVQVTDAATGEAVGGGRTYTSPQTNPRVVPLPPGTYHVEVRAVAMAGEVTRRFENVAVASGATVEKVVDFGTGELAVGVTRNGARSDATVNIYAAGTTTRVEGGRTYTGEGTNPLVHRLTAGTYDVEVGSVEIKGAPPVRREAVVVEAGGLAAVTISFDSGTLRVGAARGGGLVDAVVSVHPSGGGVAVAQGRTYVDQRTNPRAFEVPPGRYLVKVQPVKLEGAGPREIEVEVTPGGIVERLVEFGQ